MGTTLRFLPNLNEKTASVFCQRHSKFLLNLLCNDGVSLQPESWVMPLYELFCLARPTLAEPVLKDIVKKAAVLILDRGGVLCDIKSYGVNDLGYPIRKPNDGVFEQAAMWGMDFMVGPSALPEVEHNLRVDEGVLRWVVLKKKPYPNLPKPTQLFYIPELDNPNRKRRSPMYPPPSMVEREM